ncbi:MAG: hypothetical protein OEY01_16055 [Desulfobulbaceae bacterium]|nr:hypothetical protein [Desulfobulbaceae bacterium]HIJ80007.1 hypothetical protein [Deltaproteobacteria bacterium]
MTNSNASTNWVEIILTALLTSTLTLGCSYFIMKSQLSDEQKYWSERFRTERAQDILNKKVTLLEELNAGILESEILAKEIKLSFSSFNALLETCRVDPECDLNSVQLDKKVVDYHKHINRLAAKFQMVPLYFSNDIALMVEPLSRAIESNYEANTKTLIEFSITDPKQTKDYFERDFNTVGELTKIRLILIKKMLDDINTYAGSIYTPNAAYSTDPKVRPAAEIAVLGLGDIMDANTVTLIVGLSGIGATLIASGMGFYFTAKARSSALREALFSKQIDLIARALHKQGRFRVFVTILAGKDDAYRDLAREDIGECIKEFSEIQEEGAAILPTELWIEVKKLNDHMADLLINYDEGNGIPEENFKNLVAMMAKVGLVSRSVIGTDELTEESISLFSSKKKYEELANLEHASLRKLHKGSA